MPAFYRSIESVLSPYVELPGRSIERHFQTVQFFFQKMKGIVADFVIVAHREHGTARGFDGAAVKILVRRSRVVRLFTTWTSRGKPLAECLTGNFRGR